MTKVPPTVRISPDNMQAILEIPSIAADVSIESIENALAIAEVRTPVSPELIADLVQLHHAGKNISGTVLAIGVLPTPAMTGEIIPYGNLGFPVFPGDVFGTLKLASPAKTGVTVRGTILPAPNTQVKVQNIKPAANETVIEARGSLVAARYGLVTVENNEVSISPLMQLSEDLMTLSACIYPKDFQGAKITNEKIFLALKAMGLRARPNLIILEEAIEKAKRLGAPVTKVEICKGIKPFKGEDGWLEILVEQGQIQAGAIDASGNIDYKKRGEVRTVKAGDTLVRIHMPGRGRPGRTLLGDTVQGEDGSPAFFKLGENVELSEDRQSIRAIRGGLFVNQENEFSISEMYTIQEDVSLRTGHIALERGSVYIDGSVLSGLHVTCPGSIFVKGTVEDTILTAGGDIDIQGGVVMNNNGFIRAFGSVRARYAVGTNIHAGDNVYIYNEVNKSTIIAEGTISVTGGKGKVVGGLLHCGKEIQAIQLGSELGAPTTIRLGVDESFLEEYKSEHSRLSTSIDFIIKKLGSENDEEIVARFPEEKLATVKHILSIRSQLNTRISELAKSIQRLERQMNTPGQYVLKVMGTIFPGVTVHCQQATLPIYSPVQHSKITFDPARQQLILAGL